MMKAFIFFLTAINFSVFAAEPSPQEDESGDPSRPRFISPDGRYGLLVTRDPEGESHKDRVELIELATKRPLVLLSDPEAFGDRGEDARLDWFTDSKRVAAYTGGRRGGLTQIFVRQGDGFAEVKLPELPKLPEKPSPAFAKKHKFKFLKTVVDHELAFVRWSKSGDLELELYNEFVAAGGGPNLGWRITMTLAIDSKHQAKLKNVVKKEVADD